MDEEEFTNVGFEENAVQQKKQVLKELLETKYVYVVTIDDHQRFYTKIENHAKNHIIDLSRNFNICDTSYSTYYQYENEDTIHIIGSNKFLVVSYDRIIHTIRYHKIQEY